MFTIYNFNRRKCNASKVLFNKEKKWKKILFLSEINHNMEIPYISIGDINMQLKQRTKMLHLFFYLGV